MGASLLDKVIRQFVFVSRCLRKMRGEHAADIVNRFNQRVGELLALKTRPHSIHNSLPQLLPRHLVNRSVPNHSKLMSTGCHKNQHRIALARLVHTEPMKLPLRRNEGITLQLAALDQNANLTGGFGFRFANCFNDPVVLEFAEEFSRSHFVTSSIPRRLRRNCRRHR